MHRQPEIKIRFVILNMFAHRSALLVPSEIFYGEEQMGII